MRIDFTYHFVQIYHRKCAKGSDLGANECETPIF